MLRRLAVSGTLRDAARNAYYGALLRQLLLAISMVITISVGLYLRLTSAIYKDKTEDLVTEWAVCRLSVAQSGADPDLLCGALPAEGVSCATLYRVPTYHGRCIRLAKNKCCLFFFQFTRSDRHCRKRQHSLLPHLVLELHSTLPVVRRRPGR